MPARPRPLSPHLQVYRWHITMVLSILHRMTGVALALGLVPLSLWFVAVAGGRDGYEQLMRLYGSVPGLLLLLGWTFAFFYHLMNGVRHLCWDAGWGFERGRREGSGWVVLIGAVSLTLLVGWLVLRGVRP